MAVAKKTRNIKIKTDEQRKTDIALKSVRKKLPINTLEIEIEPFNSHFSLRKNGKHKYYSNDAISYTTQVSDEMRQIRNTTLGVVCKNYTQMIRTKKYKGLIKSYRKLSEQILKLEKSKVIGKETKNFILELKNSRKAIANEIEDLKIEYNVTKSFAVDYAKDLKDTTFKKVSSIFALKCADRVWLAVEKKLFGNADQLSFQKKGHLPSLEAKQANRGIILKLDKSDEFYLTFDNFKFKLNIKKEDLYIKETLENIKYYMNCGDDIDEGNINLLSSDKPLISTYRINYNRIVVKEIRGRKRIYLQIVYEGEPVNRRKKDGSFRHKYGLGITAHDVGTQSVAIVTDTAVELKNLAERSKNTLCFESKIRTLNRAMDRSKRVNNPEFFNKDGTFKKRSTIKKGTKWVESKNYIKIRRKHSEEHRKAALSRMYAINEEVNNVRALGDVAIVEQMNFKALQKRAKETTTNEMTGRFNRKKLMGKSIGKRCPGRYISQLKRRFEATGGTFKEVNTWTFKASQYDHKLRDCNKKQLSQRWHRFSDGIKVQRDLYSSMLLFCIDNDYAKPDPNKCDKFFPKFFKMHNECIENIKANKINVLNSGIKI